MTPDTRNVPFVSVIIPVFNDVERLRICLDALERQSYPADRYEVIVADNGSTEDLRGLAATHPHVVLTREDRPGSYAARNKGLSLARGPVLGFTDSDCIPREDWIERGAAAVSQGADIGIAGGRVDFFFRDPNKPTAVELYDSIRNLQQDKYIREIKYAATANLFTRRDVFEKVGLFNMEVKSGGDRDWGQRVAANGFRLVYADDARVDHPARHSFKQLHKKVVRVVGGHHQWKKKTGYSLWHRDFIADLVHDFSPPVRFLSRLRTDNRVKGFKNKTKVLFIFMLDKYLRAWTRIRLQFGSKPTR